MKEQGLALQVVKEVAAQVLDHVLAHTDGQVVVAQLHEADQEVDADQHAHHAQKLGAHGPGLQVRPPTEDVQGLVPDDLVDGQLERPGFEKFHGAGHADQAQPQHEQMPVGAQIAKQGAKHAHGVIPWRPGRQGRLGQNVRAAGPGEVVNPSGCFRRSEASCTAFGPAGQGAWPAGGLTQAAPGRPALAVTESGGGALSLGIKRLRWWPGQRARPGRRFRRRPQGRRSGA